MKIIDTKLYTFLFILFFSTFSFAQTTIEQEDMFNELLIEKRTQNQALSFKGIYTIQIFSGDYNEAKKNIEKSLVEFSNLDQSIEFNTPSYKIWIGCFDNRIDAERNLIRIQNTYPSAFVIKLKK